MSRNRICKQPMIWLDIHPRGFFSFWGVVWRWNVIFLCSHAVLHDVLQVSNVFPKRFRNSISPYLISFAQNSPFLSYIAETKGDTPSSHKTCYFGEPPKFQFFWVMGNLKWPLVKGKFRKRTLEAAHLIPVMSNQNWCRGGFWNPLCGHGRFQRQFQK